MVWPTPPVSPVATPATEDALVHMARYKTASQFELIVRSNGRADPDVARSTTGVVGYGRVSYFARPDDAPAGTAPEGWYLGGLLVEPSWRRGGIGRQLTQARLRRCEHPACTGRAASTASSPLPY